MGIADDLPDPSVSLGKTDHGQTVVLVIFRNVNSDILIKPVMSARKIGKSAESLNHGGFVLAYQELMKLLRGVRRRPVVAVLG